MSLIHRIRNWARSTAYSHEQGQQVITELAAPVNYFCATCAADEGKPHADWCHRTIPVVAPAAPADRDICCEYAADNARLQAGIELLSESRDRWRDRAIAAEAKLLADR